MFVHPLINTGDQKRDEHLKSADFVGITTHPTLSLRANLSSIQGTREVLVSIEEPTGKSRIRGGETPDRPDRHQKDPPQKLGLT